MDWIFILKVIATVVCAVLAVGLIYVVETDLKSYDDDPGTGY
jgi:hypothetical protein